MNTNIVVSLDTRRKKKDGSYPIIMRLGHNGKTTSIPLGLSIDEKDWDDKQRKVKKTYTGVNSVTWLNNRIQKMKTEAMNIILKLHEDGILQTLPITSLKDRITQKDAKDSFFEFANQCVNELIAANRIGTARSYKGIISILKDYRKGRDLLFKEITYEFLTKFEIYHKAKGNGINGLAVYMRTIRSIYNKGIKSGRVEKELYPFDDYKIKTAPTEKRALDIEFLKKIIELDLAQDHLCFDTRGQLYDVWDEFRGYGISGKNSHYQRSSQISSYKNRKALRH